MKHKSKNIEVRKTSFSNLIRRVLFFCFYFLFSFSLQAQDSIALPEDLNEEKELKFQQYFFKALSEKSINNFQKAIENLESCNQILSNDVAVFFEFSKNYYSLNKTQLAKEYIDRALVKQPDDVWMLKHLVAVLQKANNYGDAIEVQKKIIKQHPKDTKLKESLSRLYLRNNQAFEALLLLREIEIENGLPNYLQRLKASLEKRNSGFKKKEDEPKKLGSFIDKFETDKTYKSLEELLTNSVSEAVLLKYSKQGIQLFPAQPLVYFVQGKMLNNKKSYKKALTVLKNGVDFVFEDKIEKDFYKEIARSYKGLGNKQEEKKYLKKSN